LFFFFKLMTSYERRMCDWSSDVCSSDLVEPLLGAALLILAIAVERHGAARRLVRAMPLAVMLHEELLVEQPPEQRHRLAGELGLDLVGSALNRDGRVAR